MNGQVSRAEAIPVAPATHGERLVRALAGHELTLDARPILKKKGIEARDTAWIAAGKRRPGAVLTWTPASPGLYRIHIEQGGRRVHTVRLVVGLRPSDLQEREAKLSFFFCLIVRDGAKVNFVPILHPKRKERDLRRVTAREALAKEAGAHHPAFAAWAEAHTSLYRRRVLRRPFFDIGRVADGLYAVFPNDVVYLGGAPNIAAAAAAVKDALREAATGRPGAGAALRQLESVVAKLTPRAYRYANDAQWPQSGRRARRANQFVASSLAPFVAAGARFARQVGTSVEPGGATLVLSYNGRNATLGSRLVDSRNGMSRHLASAFDVLMTPAQLAMTRAALTKGKIDFGRFAGFTGGAQSFPVEGGSLTALGVGALGRAGAASAAAADGANYNPARDVKAGGTEVFGKIYVSIKDGSTVVFDEDRNGNPIVFFRGINEMGGYIVTGGETIVDFTEDGGRGGKPDDPDGGIPGGGDGTDGGAPSGGGYSGGDDDDGGTPASGDDDDGGTPASGDDDGGTPASGDDDGGEEGPSGADPEASMTTGDDGDMGGEGDGRRWTPLGTLGTITLGGGYTDPGVSDPVDPVDDSGEGGEDGPVRIVPGWGVTDPSDPTGGGGFDYWGAFQPPVRGNVDPAPTVGSYAARADMTRATMSRGGTTVSTFAGRNASGIATDGIIGCGAVQPGYGRQAGGPGGAPDTTARGRDGKPGDVL